MAFAAWDSLFGMIKDIDLDFGLGVDLGLEGTNAKMADVKLTEAKNQGSVATVQEQEKQKTIRYAILTVFIVLGLILAIYLIVNKSK